MEPARAPIPNETTTHKNRLMSSSFLNRVEAELKIEDIKPELTVENYREKFHKLLCWEEKEHITILHERCE